jgi:hypothetical protein
MKGVLEILLGKHVPALMQAESGRQLQLKVFLWLAQVKANYENLGWFLVLVEG